MASSLNPVDEMGGI